MNHPDILVPATVPTDPQQARSTRGKIQEGLITPHPDHQKEIMDKLDLIISGKYIEPSMNNIFDLSDETMAEIEKEREEKAEVSGHIEISLRELKKAEEMVSKKFSTTEQIKVAKVKVELLELLNHFKSSN
jgi:hypothetical protein